jgi:type VI secretion system secreted protein Hcp
MKQGLRTLTPGNLRFAIQSPVDHATGQSSGKRLHEPLTIVKEVDEASPLYLTARCNNEVIGTLNLNLVKTNGQGKTERYITITLTNAALAGYVRKPLPHKSSTGRQQFVTNELEEFQITFQKIDYTWTKGGISSSDSWDAPVK